MAPLTLLEQLQLFAFLLLNGGKREKKDSYNHDILHSSADRTGFGVVLFLFKYTS